MFRNFFKGRYGIDYLSISLIIFSLVFLFSRYLWIISLVLLGIILFRAYSRDFAKRNSELQKYYSLTYKISSGLNKIFGPLVRKIKLTSARMKQRKDYSFLRCRYCKKKLRVPKNKGKIKITCPNCKNEFITKT